MDFAFTPGGSPENTTVAARTPALLGFSTDSAPPSGFDWNFVDWPFEPDVGANRFQHVLWVESTTPQLAVAPDLPTGGGVQSTLTGAVEDQPNTLSPETVLDVADELSHHAETVIVVPHSNEFPPEDVPDQYRVGVPASAGFGVQSVPGDLEFSPDTYNAVDNGLHVLGGGLQRQREMLDLLDDVRSLDSSWPIGRMVTEAGAVWDGFRRRDRAEQPDWLRDLENLAKMYVNLHTWSHSVGMVNLFQRAGVAEPASDKGDVLLRAAMANRDRDLAAIGKDLLGPEWSVRVRDDGRFVADASVTDVDPTMTLTEPLRDFGFRNIEAEGTRGGIILTADPPEIEPDTSEFDLRPGVDS